MRAGRGRRVALAVLAAAMLGGCAAALDPQGFGEEVSSIGARDRTTDQAMSALSRGDYPNAERFAIQALRRNPKDPYALVTAGMVYQGTGRYDLARQYYEVIVTNQPQATILVPGEGAPAPRSVVDVARTNLAAIDKITGRAVPRSIAQSGRAPEALPPEAPPPPAGRAVVGQALEDMAARPPVAAPPSRLAPSQAEANVGGRFRVLRCLLDEGLITHEEYARRRGTNLGALLPYSAATPPSAGLERPLPADDQVVERLKALAAALEARGITARELAAERAAILDALLPAAPRAVELPVLPPKDMIEAAAAVGRLERLRAVGLVSAEEVAREKEAVEKALDGSLAGARVAGSATGLRQGAAPPPANGGARYVAAGAGVSLATLKTEEAARKQLASLRNKFPEQLGKLDGTVRRVDLGEKGVRWRVLAGPLATRDQARALCKVLKLHRQACDPAAFERPAPPAAK